MTPSIEKLKRQRGASLLAVIFFIVAVAFLGNVVVALVATQSFTSRNEVQSTQALYVAEGGLERATRALLAPPLAERVTCAAVTASASLTNIGLGVGRFTVTRDAGAPFNPLPAATLSGAIGPTDTSIQVSSTAGYAQAGRIMIDREYINYTGVLAGPPRFTGAKRGAGGTSTVTHANGTRVAQYQCSVSSEGGVTDLVTPTGRRVVALGAQLEGGWAGGKATAQNELYRWNDIATPNVWARATSVAQEIRGVDVLSAVDGWAVGKKIGTRYNIARWDGLTWTQLAPPTIPPDNGGNQNLESVSMVSAIEGWAAGDNGVILHWDGATWHTNHHAASTTTADLKSISMVASNSGWVVGKAGTIIHFDGAWHTNHHTASPTAEDFNDVFMGSAASGWIVGKAAAGILHWDGASWHRNDTHGLAVAAQDLNGLHMISSSQGWGVGRNGLIYHYLSTGVPAWHTGDAHSTSPIGQELTEVFMLSELNGWAVGKSGVIVHWDSSVWSAVASPANQDLKGLSMIPSGTPPQSTWREVFN